MKSLSVNSKLKEIESDFVYCTNLVLSRYDEEFNFSAKCNQGADAASGSILIFFNDDALPMGKDWMDATIEYLNIPGVGGVSPGCYSRTALSNTRA